METTRTRDEQRARAAHRALARSVLYQLLSQALSYPEPETLATLKDDDLPQALEVLEQLPHEVSRCLRALGEQLEDTDAAELQLEHRRIFTHVLTMDCPPCETFYTARHLFQETQELSDIGGFFRAFGLELAERERPDHISVELEFMHVLTYKEAYALLHHGPAKARLCRRAQRKFMQDHLGRWAPLFAERLQEKAGAGYFGAVAALLDAVISAEVRLLRARPEAVFASPQWRTTDPEDDGCPPVDQ